MNTPFNPLPNLPNLKISGKDDKIKKQRKPRDRERYYTKPVYIKKLGELYHGSEVARIVGCSSSVIYDAIKNDTVAKAYELCAERFYMLELEKQTISNVTFTANVSQDVWNLLQPWLNQSGAEYKVFMS